MAEREPKSAERGGWVPAERLISEDPGVRTPEEDLAAILAPIAEQVKPIVKKKRRHRPHDRPVKGARRGKDVNQNLDLKGGGN